MSTTPIRTTIRAALLALVALTAVLAVRPGTASAQAPNVPVILASQGYEDFIRLQWAAPGFDGGQPVTGYTIERYTGNAVKPDHTWHQKGTTALVDHDVVDGVTYKYRLRATNVDGDGGWTQLRAATVNPFLDPLHKFDGDPAAFVQQQYQDFAHRAPSFGELNTAVLGLKNGTIDPEDVIRQRAMDPARTDLRHPVIRLYESYFHRSPDHAGLTYWVAQRAKGVKLDVVSAKFAASSEFQHTYGDLSDQAFVTLVYQNVLHRDPDQVGLDYWTGKLTDHTVTRGRVMSLFSESNENKAKALGLVVAIDVQDTMLGQPLIGSPRVLWASHIQHGGNAGDFGLYLMLDIDYQP